MCRYEQAANRRLEGARECAKMVRMRQKTSTSSLSRARPAAEADQAVHLGV